MNSPISAINVIISTVVLSATEAECAALFIVGQVETRIRYTLHDLGYPQGRPEIVCDHKCAQGIKSGTVKQSVQKLSTFGTSGSEIK